jgi:sugar O-acyltransferase (sialic acid O-acetyltransferase NeuD family)
MKKLYIVGAGGFGRELAAWINDLPAQGRGWVWQGFLDDNVDALKSFGDFATVSPLSSHRVSDQNIYLCGIGTPAIKRKLVKPLLEQGAVFISYVHPRATIGDRVKLGLGVVICPECVLSCDIELGDFAMVNLRSTIGHDAKVGPWSTISAQCDLTGGVELGTAVFLGSRVSVIPGKKVGDGATVGAGSTVMTNVPAHVTVVGNPARVL